MTAEPRVARFGLLARQANVLWLVAGGVLLAEYLLVSLCFDAGAVRRRGGGWGYAAQFGAIAPMGVAVATALLLFRRTGVGEAPPGAFPKGRRLFRLSVHGLLYAAFVALTAHLFGGAALPAGPAAVWLAVWGLLGAGSALALFAGLVGVKILMRRVLSGWALAGAAMGAAAWLAGHLAGALWEPLSSLALHGTGGLLRVIAPGVVVDPSEMLLELDGFAVTIAPVCSGIEGMGLITVLLGGYVIVLRRTFRFPNALLLVPIGIVAVWLGNTVRLAALMLVGAYVSPDIALGGFHSKAGWVLFCAVALIVATAARGSAFFSREVADSEDSENPTAAFLMPLLALVATALITAMFAGTIDPLYGARLAPAALMVWFYRRHYAGLAQMPSLLSLVAGALVGVAWVLSEPAREASSQPSPSVTWMAVRALGSVVAAPVCEELAFRGFLLRRLISPDFMAVSFRTWTPLSVVASSLAFGVVHERWLAASLAGAAYALVQVRSGRLADAIAAHAATNAVVTTASLVTGDWAAWG